MTLLFKRVAGLSEILRLSPQNDSLSNLTCTDFSSSPGYLRSVDIDYTLVDPKKALQMSLRTLFGYEGTNEVSDCGNLYNFDCFIITAS